MGVFHLTLTLWQHVGDGHDGGGRGDPSFSTFMYLCFSKYRLLLKANVLWTLCHQRSRRLCVSHGLVSASVRFTFPSYCLAYICNIDAASVMLCLMSLQYRCHSSLDFVWDKRWGRFYTYALILHLQKLECCSSDRMEANQSLTYRNYFLIPYLFSNNN